MNQEQWLKEFHITFFTESVKAVLAVPCEGTERVPSDCSAEHKATGSCLVLLVLPASPCNASQANQQSNLAPTSIGSPAKPFRESVVSPEPQRQAASALPYRISATSKRTARQRDRKERQDKTHKPKQGKQSELRRSYEVSATSSTKRARARRRMKAQGE